MDCAPDKQGISRNSHAGAHVSDVVTSTGAAHATDNAPSC
jgi:hypothetical protein